MLKLMQKKAKDFISDFDSVDSGLDSEVGIVKIPVLGSKINGGLSFSENAEQLSGASEKNSTLGSKIDDVNGNVEELEVVGSVSNEGESNSGELGGRGRRIKEALERELSPVELEVEDISYQHAGHAGVRGSGDGETHFNVRVVSKEFEGKSLIKRHRLIYALLQEELQSGLHALSIEAKTPAEVSTK